MSMVINLVEDHNIYLCEGGPVYNGGVQPITYLTNWKIVGNSEVHGQEIWSCGEYNPIDGKYHILVQPLGGSIADIALDEPLRKVNNVADTIEFPAVLEAFNDADGNQVVTTLPDNTILHIQNKYDYTQIVRVNVGANAISQRSAEIKIIQTTGASYLGIGMPLTSGIYYSSCQFKNDDAKPNIIYSNSGNSSTVSSSDYQKTSLFESNVTMFRYSALNNPTGVWEVNDVFFVKDINIFDIDAMFADCTDLKPASASDFEVLFPNLGYIDRINTAIDVIVKEGKLYKYIDTEGKALVTRNLDTTDMGDLQWSQQLITNKGVYRQITTGIQSKAKIPEASVEFNCLCVLYNPATYSEQISNLQDKSIMMSTAGYLSVYDTDYNQNGDTNAFTTAINGVELIYELATSTTELVDAPQIAEAESYTCVISQGAKCVEWSSFETE